MILTANEKNMRLLFVVLLGSLVLTNAQNHLRGEPNKSQETTSTPPHSFLIFAFLSTLMVALSKCMTTSTYFSLSFYPAAQSSSEQTRLLPSQQPWGYQTIS